MARKSAERTTYRVQVLERAVDILQVLSEDSRELAAGEVAERLSLHKSTIHRLLTVLDQQRQRQDLYHPVPFELFVSEVIMRLRILLTALLLSCASVAHAQFDSGQISGFVRDSSGAVIPGATVTATNEGNGQQRVVVSNSEGYYVFPSLLVGAYKISAELSGFNRFITTGVRLSAAARISVDMTLSVGTLTDTVEVQAAAILTESPVLGRTVGEQQIQQLPLSGRNPVFVARLQAGVVGGSLGSFGGTSIGTGIQSISGGRANDVLVTVDGAIANRTRSTEDTMLGAQHVDTVQEVQVLTTNYSAEYGTGLIGHRADGHQGWHPGLSWHRDGALPE